MAWEHQTQPTQKPKIVLCLAHTGVLSAEFIERTWGPLRFKPVGWCDKIPLLCKMPSLPVARNVLAQQALDQGASHVLWVDSDCVPEAPEDPNEALRLLLTCNEAIVGCLYRAKQKVGFNYAAWINVGDKQYTPITGYSGNWFTVDVTGLHFCLVRADVFRKTPKPWFHWDDEGEVSEDFYFFEKARAAGYRVKIFADVKMSHLGCLKLKTTKEVTTQDV